MTVVQPSPRIFTSARPALIIGSIVNSMPGAQGQPLARVAVVLDLGRVVEDAAEAVADEVAHHREAVGLGDGLDGVADIAQRRAGPDGADAGPHRLEGDLDQLHAP